jgi:hypothetical protein
MNSNLFSIVPCSICPSTTLLKTAYIWKESVFCSTYCLRKRIEVERLKNESVKIAERAKFFKPVSRLSETRAVQAIVEDRHL